MAGQISKRTGIGQRILRWLTGFTACTLIALFLAGQWFLAPAMRGSSEAWPHLIGHYLLACYVWGLLSIAIVSITSRVGLDRSRWLQSLATYLLIGVAFAIIHVLASSSILRLLGPMLGIAGPHSGFSFTTFLAATQSNLIIFTVITSVCLALSYYRKFQDRELRATRLEAQLTHAQLDALRSQLQPHFLFNTLNAIAALVRENPEAAERMIVRLSDLLRTTLDNVGKQEVQLSEELEFARRYLEIEKMRFGERLVVEERIEPKTLRAQVPALVLQPLVENAMRHGVAPVSRACQVVISSCLSGTDLVLEVWDTGPGMKAEGRESHAGLGIANTRDRLRHLYGEACQFQAGNRDGGGFTVRIVIPFSVTGAATLSQRGRV